MPAIARFRGVSKTYSSGETKVTAVRDLTFEIPAGEMAAFVGPSGSGKTTVLNLLGCIDRPDSGQIEIAGTDIGPLKPARLAELRNERIGFVFQSFNLIPVLTAFENVEFPLLLGHPGSAAERRDRVLEMLRHVGIEGLHGRLPSRMSGGQQQRVAIARALVKNPALVLADEPTANLDSKSAAEILDIMHRMNQELKTTFLFSTHDPKIMHFADRLIRLEDGAIIGDERPS